jgi:hypothetical protein
MKYKNKTKTKKHLVGGVKQKNLSLTSWQAVYKMICTPGATLTAISYRSVEGFIFKLDIPHNEEYAEFYGLNNDGTAFIRPIYSLIFKIAIIFQTSGDKLNKPLIVTDSSGKEKHFPKNMPSLRDFIYEAHAQQYIYNTTLYPVGRPITIGVVDFSYFDRISSKKLIYKLKSLLPVNSNVEPMLNYLYTHVSRDRMIGLITMDLVNSDFIKLYEVEDTTRDMNIINSDYDYAIAQILILFTKVRIINRDCHSGNILASKNSPSSINEIRSLLIDFGRILKLDGERYKQMKRQICEMYDKFNGTGRYDLDIEQFQNLSFTDLYSNGTYVDDNKVIIIMHNIIRFIAYIDYIVKKIKNPNTSRDYPQMLDILEYLYGTDVSDFHIKWERYIKELTPNSIAKYKAIIPLFFDLTRDPQKRNLVSKAAIEKNITNEAIFNIDSNTNIHHFNQSNSDWTPNPTIIDEDHGIKDHGMRNRKNKRDNCNKPCDPNDPNDPDDPENKDDCCQRITKKVLNIFGIKYGGNPKHKNKHSKKNNKTRKNNKIV